MATVTSAAGHMAIILPCSRSYDLYRDTESAGYHMLFETLDSLPESKVQIATHSEDIAAH